MESFERYAGFFPEGAIPMMRRRDVPAGYGATDPIIPILPGGPWADAVLPEVMGMAEPAAPLPASPVLARLGHRIRAFLARG